MCIRPGTSFPCPDSIKLRTDPLLKVKVKVLVTQSCLTLCAAMDCFSPGFSDHGILQARILEWIAIPFFRGSSWPRDWTQVSCIAGWLFTTWATREALCIWNCLNSLSPLCPRDSQEQSSVQSFSCVWLQPHGLQHARLPCPSPTSGACS